MHLSVSFVQKLLFIWQLETINQVTGHLSEAILSSDWSRVIILASDWSSIRGKLCSKTWIKGNISNQNSPLSLTDVRQSFTPVFVNVGQCVFGACFVLAFMGSHFNFRNWQRIAPFSRLWISLWGEVQTFQQG